MKKHSERIKVQKILDKIKENNFSPEDIDLLLIKLREYALPKSLFEEISHFAAHNESRHKGFSFEHLSGYFDTILFLYNHTLASGKPLDFSKPIPAYVINTILFNQQLLSPDDFQRKYKCSQTQFKSRFHNTFLKIKGTNTYKIKGTLKGTVGSVVQDMLSYIFSYPLYTDKQIFNEIFTLLQANDFDITFDQLNIRYKKIILFIIYLMHNTEYQITDSLIGISQIHITPSTTDTIQLSALVPLPKGDGKFMFPLITTDLDPAEFCSENLLKHGTNEGSQLIINDRNMLDIQ